MATRSAGLTVARTSAAVLARMAGKAHLHICRDGTCKSVYRCNCTDTIRNDLCKTCQGKRRPIWDVNLDHVDCCTSLTQVTSNRVIEAYDLAGPGPWFCCRTCYRFHGKRKND